MLKIKKRIIKLKQSKTVKLKHNPQKRAICSRVLTISPKKPNSANRKVIKANIAQYNTQTTVKIPGEMHNLQQHSSVLIQGGRVKDLIGVNYKAVRGVYDLNGVANRKSARSTYGVKKSK